MTVLVRECATSVIHIWRVNIVFLCTFVEHWKGGCMGQRLLSAPVCQLQAMTHIQLTHTMSSKHAQVCIICLSVS